MRRWESQLTDRKQYRRPARGDEVHEECTWLGDSRELFSAKLCKADDMIVLYLDAANSSRVISPR